MHTVQLLQRKRLSEGTFELTLSRPSTFRFIAGQRLRLRYAGVERDYSLVSAPDDPTLVLCVRHVLDGQLTPLLASAAVGTSLEISGPHGYFTFRPSARPAVFVATGTGIAPFASMARSRVTGFTLLHGVRRPTELHYEALLRSTARQYIPCLSGPLGEARSPDDAFSGRVTAYLADHPTGKQQYDFYLCGRTDMIRDVTHTVDERFPESLVYTESFY